MGAPSFVGPYHLIFGGAASAVFNSNAELAERLRDLADVLEDNPNMTLLCANTAYTGYEEPHSMTMFFDGVVPDDDDADEAV